VGFYENRSIWEKLFVSYLFNLVEGLEVVNVGLSSFDKEYCVVRTLILPKILPFLD
jgi:hypothetical protein